MKNHLEHRVVASATRMYLLKPGDVKLIAFAKKTFGQPAYIPAADTALFYPSAGSDLLAPLIVALPYCNQFYFYEHNLSNFDVVPPQDLLHFIKHIKGITTSQNTWVDNNNDKSLKFDYNGIEKNLYWVNNDNLNFLSHTHLSLSFYFHRGDSHGEGGSRQFWDSELLSALRNMINPGDLCYFITDGEPGGPAFEIENTAKTIVVNDEVMKYYVGQLTHR